MNYKNFIKSRNLRVKILSKLNWVPDVTMLKLQYWLQTGRKLNLNKPQRFTEKLQLYKLKYRNPQMLRCTDKYEVRHFVAERGLQDLLIPLLGIYNDPSEIDFNQLPDKFVAKTTDGSGGNQVLVCRDKSALDKTFFHKQLQKWISQPKVKKNGRSRMGIRK